MGNIYFTSDLHFGHNRDFIFGPRGFTNVQDHDETIIKTWNALVQPDDNVYILGTMNTADRSIALLDTALRRRFTFREMMPKPELLNSVIIEGLSIGKMLDNMNKKITVLFDREHTIGHAYFMTLNSNSTVRDLAVIFENCIIPLLQEYFYDDYEKIRLVLGDNNKQDDKLVFVKATATDNVGLFGSVSFDFDETFTYEINEKAFDEIDSYKSI